MDEFSLRYRGWRVVLACFLMALFGWGLGFYGHSVYLAELTRVHGWPASLISSASTLYYLVSAVLVAFVSDAVQRLGPKPVVLGGIAAFALSTVGIGLATRPVHIFAAYLVMSAGWAAMTLAAITNTLGLWFEQRRGLAISVALNGASAGGIVGVPVLVFLIDLYGFRAAMSIVAAAIVVLLAPIVALWIDRPQPGPHAAAASSTGAAPRAEVLTRSRVMLTAHFWTIAAPFALALMAQVGFIVHQIAFLETPLGRHGAGLAVAVTTVMAVVGRVGMGFLIDRLDQRRVTAASLVSQAIALLVMTQTAEPAVLYGACALFGFSVGNLITLPALIIQREYESNAFGMLTALVVAINQVAYSFGPGLLGILRDMTGSYAASLALCMALEILGAIIVLLRVPR
jgi:MFS family permease